MRVICPHCHGKALITSSNIFSETVRDLYCTCINSRECGASFVMTLAFKHDLNPPQQTTLKIIATLIQHLNAVEKRQLQRDFLS